MNVLQCRQWLNTNEIVPPATDKSKTFLHAGTIVIAAPALTGVTIMRGNGGKKVSNQKELWDVAL
ncbi:MAG: hypothetical protein ACYS6W_09210 [Planctomycetota bacterium]|jgi:hypothetical protein